MVVAVCFYIDFIITGLIISNYEFLSSDKPYFINLKEALDDPNKPYTFTNIKISGFMNHQSTY